MPVRTNRLLASATTTIEGSQSGSTWWSNLNPDTAFGITDTIPGDISTTASVAVGGSATAWISPGNDTDWFSINVVAGQTYLVSLRGSGSDPIEDPLLILHDNLGAVLIQDDDGGSRRNSLLTFTAAYTGVYFVEARTFDQAEAPGEYTIDLRRQGADAVPDTFVGAVALDLSVVTFGFIESGFDTVYTDAGEVDSYKFEVEAGKTYTIEVAGGHDSTTDYLNLPSGELDTQIRIYGSDFSLVASNDDIGLPNDASSRVTFIATTSGTYYLDVNAWEGWTGGYSITAAVKTSDPLDSIDWGTQLASNAVTVYFAGAGEIFDGVTSLGWSAYEIDQTMEALAVYSTFSDLTFAITSDQASATFTLVSTDLAGDTAGYFHPPGTTNEGVGAFDVVGLSWTSPDALEQGGYSFFVLLHEFGHGLGLAHPHDNGGTSEIMPGVTAPRGSYGFFDLNQGVYTIMSYNASWPFHPLGLTPFSVDTVGSGWSGTPEAFDIALIQQKYGAVAHNAGNDTYVLAAANAVGAFYSCIWDTGGIDEIVQNGSVVCRIDLTAATLDYSPTGGGVVSYVDGVYGGFTIANTVVIENASGGAGDDVLIGNSAANILTGNGGADEMLGRAGADTLDGGTGADTMTGGAGDDLYVVDQAGDQVVEAAGEGLDTVQSGITYVLGAEVEKLVLTGANAINGTGNALANILTGNNAANILNGGGGADTMTGLGGNDTYVIDNVGDVVTEAAGGGTDTTQSSLNFVLGAEVEKLVLTGVGNLTGTGNGLANTLTGNSGANALDGGAGGDTMTGGLGNDSYFVDNGLDVVVEAAGGGTDTVNASLAHSLAAEVENLILTGTASINGTGNSLANTLTGNSGANRLDGGLGADTMKGGLGDDTYIVDQAGDVVSELTGQGTDSVQSAVSFTLAVTVENLTLTGTADIDGTGNIFANILIGNSGNNILNGGAGSDVMNGGLGNDTYIVDSSSDQVSENSAVGGTDVVQSSATFTIGSNIEQLTLTGANAVNGTGNASANILIGNGAANVLDGGAGADTMTGGLGNDTYVIDNVGDVVNEAQAGGTDTIRTSANHVLAAELENLTLTGTGNVNGTGNSVVNVLTGNSGANQLDGGAGADTMAGGLGNDSYFVDNVLDMVVEAAGGGTDTVNASITHQIAAEVENLILTGVAAINGFGNALANTLTGNDAANRLDGGLGADTLKGGLGDDIYVVDQAGDIVSELAGQGTDTVQSAVSYALADAVENLSLTGSANVDATGNQFANFLLGNDGANRLNGGGGADTMNAGLGNDTYVVDNVGDIVIESSATGGTDTVESSVGYTLGATVENLILTGAGAIGGTGNAFANSLTGNGAANLLDGKAGNDALQGGAGNDILIGAAGADTLDGGTGTDRFTFQDALIAANADHVVLFETGVDKVVLENALFTGLAAGALSAGAFVAGTAAGDANDRILYDAATGNLFFDSDGTGAAAAILFATLDNTPAALSVGDFLVI